MEMGLEARRTYEHSCQELQQLGLLDPGAIPPLPAQRPSYDDEQPLGVSFFRTLVSADLSNMTLPRTFFGRSEVSEASFRNSDLSGSTLCWNDFVSVDFSNCSLKGSDMRASTFKHVNFTRSDLQDADLRLSQFEDCDFTDANLRGAKLTRSQAKRIGLSASQKEGVAWQASEG
jgi:uncharacterized protein YjbI with pentapeptide repeats